MSAVSRRPSNVAPEHALSRLFKSPSDTTGTGASGTLGGFTLTIGLTGDFAVIDTPNEESTKIAVPDERSLRSPALQLRAEETSGACSRLIWSVCVGVHSVTRN